jgi:dCTP deaminase
MVLIDYQIRKLCEEGFVTPYDESLVNPSSLDIRIGLKIILMRLKDKTAYHYILDILEKARSTDCEQVLHNFIPQLNNIVSWQEIDISNYTESNPFWLFPEDRILVESLETFYFPDNICGQFRLKSSRGGEFYEHLEAGWIDNGWHGSKLTMEIENRSLACLPLFPQLKIGQIILFETIKPDKSYKLTGRYNNDTSVKKSKG